MKGARKTIPLGNLTFINNLDKITGQVGKIPSYER
jgi:hypothetical protein